MIITTKNNYDLYDLKNNISIIENKSLEDIIKIGINPKYKNYIIKSSNSGVLYSPNINYTSIDYYTNNLIINIIDKIKEVISLYKPEFIRYIDNLYILGFAGILSLSTLEIVCECYKLIITNLDDLDSIKDKLIDLCKYKDKKFYEKHFYLD